MKRFGKFFGFKSKKADKPGTTTTGDTIQKLRAMEEMLVKKQEFLESKIKQAVATAKQNMHKNKTAAIEALKRKKRYEQQLQQTDGTLSTIEMQREALESATTNTTVLSTMSEAANALKSAHQHLDADKVHDMMDDIAEQQEVAREISDAVSNAIAFGGQDVDEGELERELEALEQEDLDEALLQVGPSTTAAGAATTAEDLPSVPPPTPPRAGPSGVKKEQPPSTRLLDADDDDMKELAEWGS